MVACCSHGGGSIISMAPRGQKQENSPNESQLAFWPQPPPPNHHHQQHHQHPYQHPYQQNHQQQHRQQQHHHLQLQQHQDSSQIHYVSGEGFRSSSGNDDDEEEEEEEEEGSLKDMVIHVYEERYPPQAAVQTATTHIISSPRGDDGRRRIRFHNNTTTTKNNEQLLHDNANDYESELVVVNALEDNHDDGPSNRRDDIHTPRNQHLHHYRNNSTRVPPETGHHRATPNPETTGAAGDTTDHDDEMDSALRIDNASDLYNYIMNLYAPYCKVEIPVITFDDDDKNNNNKSAPRQKDCPSYRKIYLSELRDPQHNNGEPSLYVLHQIVGYMFWEQISLYDQRQEQEQQQQQQLSSASASSTLSSPVSRLRQQTSKPIRRLPHFRLRYLDNDKDWIDLAYDRDLVDALRNPPTGGLKIRVIYDFQGGGGGGGRHHHHRRHRQGHGPNDNDESGHKRRSTRDRKKSEEHQRAVTATTHQGRPMPNDTRTAASTATMTATTANPSTIMGIPVDDAFVSPRRRRQGQSHAPTFSSPSQIQQQHHQPMAMQQPKAQAPPIIQQQQHSQSRRRQENNNSIQHNNWIGDSGGDRNWIGGNNVSENSSSWIGGGMLFGTTNTSPEERTDGERHDPRSNHQPTPLLSPAQATRRALSTPTSRPLTILGIPVVLPSAEKTDAQQAAWGTTTTSTTTTTNRIQLASSPQILPHVQHPAGRSVPIVVQGYPTSPTVAVAKRQQSQQQQQQQQQQQHEQPSPHLPTKITSLTRAKRPRGKNQIELSLHRRPNAFVRFDLNFLLDENGTASYWKLVEVAAQAFYISNIEHVSLFNISSSPSSSTKMKEIGNDLDLVRALATSTSVGAGTNQPAIVHIFRVIDSTVLIAKKDGSFLEVAYGSFMDRDGTYSFAKLLNCARMMADLRQPIKALTYLSPHSNTTNLTKIFISNDASMELAFQNHNPTIKRLVLHPVFQANPVKLLASSANFLLGDCVYTPDPPRVRLCSSSAVVGWDLASLVPGRYRVSMEYYRGTSNGSVYVSAGIVKRYPSSCSTAKQAAEQYRNLLPSPFYLHATGSDPYDIRHFYHTELGENELLGDKDLNEHFVIVAEERGRPLMSIRSLELAYIGM